MKTRLIPTLEKAVRRLMAISATGGVAFGMVAADLRLLIERAHVAEGFASELVQGPNGNTIVSGDFRYPNDGGDPQGRPHITVLDPSGKLVRRLNPPSISLSAQQVFLHWRVRAQLSDGTFIVDDESPLPRLPRLRLDESGTPMRAGQILPSGPVAQQRNGGVLFGFHPGDVRDVNGPVARCKSPLGYILSYDEAFASNVVRAFPAGDVYCARMVVTEDDRIWVWLAREDSAATLYRLLPDGRLDPSFHPPNPVVTWNQLGAPLGNDPRSRGLPISTWLGPLPDGGVMVINVRDDGSLRVARLREDGTTDPTFEWPFAGRPLLTLPDGSLLVEQGGSARSGHDALKIVKITPKGIQDPGWTAQIEVPGSASDDMVPTKLVLQADGSLLGIMDSGWGKRGWTRLFRLKPDGSPDPTFDASVVSPKPVTVFRLSAPDLEPGHQYTLFESAEGEALDVGVDSEETTFIFQGAVGQPADLGEIQFSPEATQRFWLLRENP